MNNLKTRLRFKIPLLIGLCAVANIALAVEGSFNGFVLEGSAKDLESKLKTAGYKIKSSPSDNPGENDCVKVPYPQKEPLKGAVDYFCMPSQQTDKYSSVVIIRTYLEKTVSVSTGFRENLGATVAEAISDKFKNLGKPNEVKVSTIASAAYSEWPFIADPCSKHDCIMRAWDGNFKAYEIFYYDFPETKGVHTSVFVSIKSKQLADKLTQDLKESISKKKKSINF